MLTEPERLGYGSMLVADLGNIPDWLKVVGGTGIGAPLVGILKFLWGNKVKADRCPYCEKNNEWRYAGGFARGFWILIGSIGAAVTLGCVAVGLLELITDFWMLIFVGACGLMFEFAAFRIAKQQRTAWKCTVCGYKQPVPGEEREARATYDDEHDASPRENEEPPPRQRNRGARGSRQRRR